MSLLFSGGLALAYASGLLGLHRFTVFRRRQAAANYPALEWLDWSTLLSGVLPAGRTGPGRAVVPAEGGPVTQVLLHAPSPEVELLAALVLGQSLQREVFAEQGFSGGEARWLSMLTELREEPRRVLEELEGATANSVAEAYLREWLVLGLDTTPLTLELQAFSSKRRVNDALRRFGDHPALYFARARASGLLGLTSLVLDDLARAVYFSQESLFYLEAVVSMTFVEETRPALLRACQDALDRRNAGATE
jgi:hypothetical protein